MTAVLTEASEHHRWATRFRTRIGPASEFGHLRVWIASSFLFALLLLLPTGCGQRDDDGISSNAPRGEPRNLSEIVETISANSAKLNAALWSSNVSATARFRDDKHKEHVFNVDGNLLFVKPRDFRMDLRPGLGAQIIGVGSNQETFWVWIEPEVRVMRWGHHRNAGRSCSEKMPIRPDQLISALVIGGLPDSSSGLSGPVLQAGKQYDILTYTASSTGERRQYYIERAPPYLVRVVRFQNAAGRDVMSASMESFKPAWSGGPLLPHAVSIFWPLDDAKFTMRIGSYRSRTHQEVSQNAFVMPTRESLPSSIREIIQVDAPCD